MAQPQPAFQSNGAFQLAQDHGFQTQLFGVWNPIDPSAPNSWTPVGVTAGGPWVPVPPISNTWVPTGG